jgi:hypothetical protein
MKKIYYSIISAIILLCIASKCEFAMDYFYSFFIYNNSNDTIFLYVALGGDEGIEYPDTTISFSQNFVKQKQINPYQKYNDGHPYTIESLFSNRLHNDTLSIYIFNQDTLDTYSWDIIQRDYKILQRYDLSLEDIYALKENNVPVIPYPPSEKMKNMKMYPPYE